MFSINETAAFGKVKMVEVELADGTVIKANLWRDMANLDLNIHNAVEMWDVVVTHSSFWKEYTLNVNSPAEIKVKYNKKKFVKNI